MATSKLTNTIPYTLIDTLKITAVSSNSVPSMSKYNEILFDVCANKSDGTELNYYQSQIIPMSWKGHSFAWNFAGGTNFYIKLAKSDTNTIECTELVNYSSEGFTVRVYGR